MKRLVKQCVFWTLFIKCIIRPHAAKNDDNHWHMDDAREPMGAVAAMESDSDNVSRTYNKR